MDSLQLYNVCVEKTGLGEVFRFGVLHCCGCLIGILILPAGFIVFALYVNFACGVHCVYCVCSFHRQGSLCLF